MVLAPPPRELATHAMCRQPREEFNGAKMELAAGCGQRQVSSTKQVSSEWSACVGLGGAREARGWGAGGARIQCAMRRETDSVGIPQRSSAPSPPQRLGSRPIPLLLSFLRRNDFRGCWCPGALPRLLGCLPHGAIYAWAPLPPFPPPLPPRLSPLAQTLSQAPSPLRGPVDTPKCSKNL